jgi:hypothetical protein
MTAADTSRHHRHLIELASILATAGLADAFADVFGMRRHGAGALIGLGVALVVGTVGHHVWLRRTDHAPPGAPAPARPGPRPGFPAAGTVPPSVPPSVPLRDGEEGDEGEDFPRVAAVWRVRTEIDDTPGRLAVFAGALAAAGANIHALEAHPTATGVVDEFVVQASPHTTAEHLCGAVRAVGGRAPHAAPADVLALLDAPTRALELAGRLVRRSASLASVLADLLDAHSVEIGDAGDAAHARGIGDVGEAANGHGGAEGTTLLLSRHDGSLVTVTRPGMAFTTTESARARSMLELEAGLGAWTCGGGSDCAEVRAV